MVRLSMDDGEARAALTEPFAHLNPDECWEWPGKRSSDGYGMFNYDGESGWHAHRVACHLFVTPLRRGLLACHACDNPPCVNWRHLYAGTFSQNMKDAVERLGTNRGSSNANAKLTEWDVRDIREMYANGCCTLAQIAEGYPVDRATIGGIVRGATWTWVKGAPISTRNQRNRRNPYRDPNTGRYVGKP